MPILKFSRSFARGLAIAGAVLAASSCALLPDSRMLEDMHYLQPVSFEGGRGPLSAKQSAAILDALKRKSGDLDILQKHVAIEEAIVGSPIVVGNRTRLLVDGPATYEAMFAVIRNAKDHINLETYIFEDDEIGHRFADMLLEKQAQGVQVNIIYDSVGSISTPKTFFDRLRAAGIAVVEFNPVNPLRAKKGWRINNRDHRKLLVVDGQTAFLGGINVSSVYSSGSTVTRRAGTSDRIPWRDTHLQLDGPVVANFQKFFMDTWTKQKGAPLAERNYFPQLKSVGNELVRAIGSTVDDPHSIIYLTLLSAINNAEKSIHLTNAYFVPDPQLLTALKESAARGVDVRLILPSQTDFWLVFHAGRSHYSDLLKAGVKIYERRDALLHAKTAVMDGLWSSIGTTNLDWRSFLFNDEVDAVVLGSEFARQMQGMFERDLQASDPVDPVKWESRPLGLRLKELTGKMWEYWL